MKVAILYDFNFQVDASREGIGVHCNFLFNSLMDIKKDLILDNL